MIELDEAWEQFDVLLSQDLHELAYLSPVEEERQEIQIGQAASHISSAAQMDHLVLSI